MDPDRFVCEASLDEIARRLRFLGFDVRTHRGARLEELFADAAREGRVVLTSSTRHPRRFAGVRAVVVSPTAPAEAVRAVADAFVPASEPFLRCPRCNAALQRRTSYEAQGEVPGRVLRRHPRLTSCPDCGRWYWPGSHVEKIRAWLEAATGRPLPLPFGPAPEAGVPGPPPPPDIPGSADPAK